MFGTNFDKNKFIRMTRNGNFKRRNKREVDAIMGLAKLSRLNDQSTENKQNSVENIAKKKIILKTLVLKLYKLF